MISAILFFCVCVCVQRFGCGKEAGESRKTETQQQTITSCSLKKDWKHGPDKDSNNTHLKLKSDGTVGKRTGP